MTKEQKRIKLAEFEGWRKEYIHGNGMDCDVWIHPNGIDCRDYEWFPDYFNDNEYCRKLEDNHVLTKGYDAEAYYYWDVLPRVAGTQAILDVGPNYRAEALGKFLKLWS